MDQRFAALEYAEKNRINFLSALEELLKIKSVSTDPVHVEDTGRAGDWIADQLLKLGMVNVQVFKTARHPIVFGEWKISEDKPTALIYGHYDVQPVDPMELWNQPPFVPTIGWRKSVCPWRIRHERPDCGSLQCS